MNMHLERLFESEPSKIGKFCNSGPFFVEDRYDAAYLHKEICRIT